MRIREDTAPNDPRTVAHRRFQAGMLGFWLLMGVFIVATGESVRGHGSLMLLPIGMAVQSIAQLLHSPRARNLLTLVAAVIVTASVILLVL